VTSVKETIEHVKCIWQVIAKQTQLIDTYTIQIFVYICTVCIPPFVAKKNPT